MNLLSCGQDLIDKKEIKSMSPMLRYFAREICIKFNQTYISKEFLKT